MATYLPLSLVISSIDFFTDGGNSCPLVKMLGLFPAFPQKIDDDLLRRRVARCFAVVTARAGTHSGRQIAFKSVTTAALQRRFARSGCR